MAIDPAKHQAVLDGLDAQRAAREAHNQGLTEAENLKAAAEAAVAKAKAEAEAIAARAAQIAADVEAKAAKLRSDYETKRAATNQALQDAYAAVTTDGGIYSLDENPRPVIYRLNGVLQFVRPTTLKPDPQATAPQPAPAP